MTSQYFHHSPARARRLSTWRRWLLVLIGIAVLFLAPALAHSGDPGRPAPPGGLSQLR